MTEQAVSDYDAVGGGPAVAAVVEDFYRRVVFDPALNARFREVNLGLLKRHQAAFISQVMGGPRTYQGQTIYAAHQGLAITRDDFSRVVVHLIAALLDAGVPEEIVTRTMRKVAGFREAIVDRHQPEVDYITPQEAAEMAQVGPDQIRRWIKDDRR